jgi:hypothetical protein
MLKTAKFADLFNIKSIEYNKTKGPDQNGGTPDTDETDKKVLTFKDVQIVMRQYTKCRNEYKGFYLPMDYIDIMLMILDPNYRILVHTVMNTINENK